MYYFTSVILTLIFSLRTVFFGRNLVYKSACMRIIFERNQHLEKQNVNNYLKKWKKNHVSLFIMLITL